MPPKTILLAGPPISITESSCSISHFLPPFQNLLSLKDQGPQEKVPSQAPHAPWRSLPLTRQPLHTGFSQNHNLGHDNLRGHAEFYTTAGVSFDNTAVTPDEGEEGAENILTQFCEQSLAIHDSIPASQLDLSAQSTSNEASFLTASSTSKPATNHPPPPVPSHLSDLEDIPPAKHIAALNPQTVTLNLIVAVISIAQPRTVTTRWGTTLSLIEVLVGDDTKSGFAVTFWVPSDKAAESNITQLRRQDVVLMENVALHVFRNKVYGQSLRRGLTRVSLLWRRDGGGYYSTRGLAKGRNSTHPQQIKTHQVKDWVLKFVGGDTRAGSKTLRKSWDQPPDDTQ